MTEILKTAAAPVTKPDAKPKPSSAFIGFSDLDRAAETAYYYGFMPIEAPVISREDSLMAKKDFSDGSEKNYSSVDDCPLEIQADEKIALLHFCQEKNLFSSGQPAMLYSENLIKRFDQEKKKLPANVRRYNLDIIGTGKSVAEAEMIKVAVEILRDEGFEDLYLDINSLGDKESMAKFTREITTYFKKNLHEMPSHCREQFKKDPLSPLSCDNKKCQELAQNAPKALAFLDEPSRTHLKEVLEYIESMNIPYRLDHDLVGNRKVCTHTIFLIKSLNVASEPEKVLALGYRYNNLAKKLEFKKDMPAVGLTILFKKTGPVKKSHNQRKPKIYFIQLGFDAKLKSLKIIEVLRKAKIPLYQSLSKDKISGQLASAEHMRIPVCLIMGQKEALEDSIIVRDMATRFQETVKIDRLSEYLKKFKFHG